MTLPPEEIVKIENRHFEAHNLPWIGGAVHQLGNSAHIHRGKLLRHIRVQDDKLRRVGELVKEYERSSAEWAHVSLVEKLDAILNGQGDEQ